MEIILGRERRRWSASAKRAIVAETIAAGEVSRIARRHGAHPAMVFAWRKQFGESAVDATPGAGFAPVEVIAPSFRREGTAAAPTMAERAPSRTAEAEACALIDVLIGTDIRLRINAGADPEVAAAVAKALAQGLAR